MLSFDGKAGLVTLLISPPFVGSNFVILTLQSKAGAAEALCSMLATPERLTTCSIALLSFKFREGMRRKMAQ